MNTNLQKLKEELKSIATKIRLNKDTFKNEQRNENQYYKDLGVDWITKYPWTTHTNLYNGKLMWNSHNKILNLKYEFRHKHIAYCLLKGRKYEQIESVVREGNEPNWNKIREIQNEYS